MVNETGTVSHLLKFTQLETWLLPLRTKFSTTTLDQGPGNTQSERSSLPLQSDKLVRDTMMLMLFALCGALAGFVSFFAL